MARDVALATTPARGPDDAMEQVRTRARLRAQGVAVSPEAVEAEAARARYRDEIAAREGGAAAPEDPAGIAEAARGLAQQAYAIATTLAPQEARMASALGAMAEVVGQVAQMLAERMPAVPSLAQGVVALDGAALDALGAAADERLGLERLGGAGPTLARRLLGAAGLIVIPTNDAGRIAQPLGEGLRAVGSSYTPGFELQARRDGEWVTLRTEAMLGPGGLALDATALRAELGTLPREFEDALRGGAPFPAGPLIDLPVHTGATPPADPAPEPLVTPPADPLPETTVTPIPDPVIPDAVVTPIPQPGELIGDIVMMPIHARTAGAS